MELLHARCAGLDIHKDTVVACVRIHKANRVEHEVREFATTTGALLELQAWIVENRCTHAVMESTGVYWKPVWHVIASDGVVLVLANAEHVRAVPGRKSDVKDAVWLADLLAHGLVSSSFVPPEPILELRDLTRTRRQLVRQGVRHQQRLQKTLEDANIKLDSVITDVLGRSGRDMIEAIVDGQTDPGALAKLKHPALRASRQELVEALRGRVTAHHRFMLRLHLDQFDETQAAIGRIDSEVGRLLEPFRAQVTLLKTIPGVSDQVARTLIAEIGVDMSVFPTAAKLRSWAGLCPRLNKTAGKNKNTRVRKGAPWLKPVIIQAAWCATRKKGMYPRAQFFRLKARRGPKKAIIAVAGTLLTAAYHMLRDGTVYQDLGEKHFDARDREKASRRLVRRLTDLGYNVQLTPLVA